MYHHSTKLYWKYHEFVAVCVVMCVQHESNNAAWYYGDNDFIIQPSISLHIQTQCA